MPPVQAPSVPARLRRDRFTLTLYGSFVAWGWWLYSFTPNTALLGEEFGVSGAVAGLHGTAMALGALAAAALAPAVVRRFGRQRAVATGALVLAAATLLLVAGPTVAWTLAATLLVAVGANVMISAAQVGLSLHHGAVAPAALLEANGAGSGIGLLGPLAAGGAIALGWGWRPAVLVTVGLAVAVLVSVLRLPTAAFASAPATSSSRPRGVPEPRGRAAAAFLACLVVAIALENATTFWSAQLVRDSTGAGAGIATATTAGLVAGMTVSRFAIGPLSLRVNPAFLLGASFGVAAVGWVVLWTAHDTTTALVGLGVTGLGFGVQYPLSLTLLLRVYRGREDRGQAHATVAGGVAIGLSPFLLGALGDHVGTHTAFVVVPALAVVGMVAAPLGARLLPRPATAWTRAVRSAPGAAPDPGDE